MSGVYIPDMEMPKNCSGCRFEHEGVCVAMNPTRRCSSYIKTNYCPLIPLPDHVGGIPITDFRLVPSNADRIRSMSIDKIIEWFCRGRPCGSCPYGGVECGIRDWLESPVKGAE